MHRIENYRVFFTGLFFSIELRHRVSFHCLDECLLRRFLDKFVVGGNRSPFFLVGRFFVVVISVFPFWLSFWVFVFRLHFSCVLFWYAVFRVGYTCIYKYIYIRPVQVDREKGSARRHKRRDSSAFFFTVRFLFFFLSSLAPSLSEPNWSGWLPFILHRVTGQVRFVSFLLLHLLFFGRCFPRIFFFFRSPLTFFRSCWLHQPFRRHCGSWAGFFFSIIESISMIRLIYSYSLTCRVAGSFPVESWFDLMALHFHFHCMW